ncbi:MAG TPA: hypothetical protein DEQ38_07955 [Elusimicrobia bacterium]|nr:MAG: hypothetical protein A2089_06185 [Elusimicrobia bacterium GWD2_63_28]HCC48029.1 hypothetical protein [Elusimicrobiota bacterium]
MHNTKKGFTLIELVVVVLIMGILASVSVPYYYKTVETSKATDSVAIGHMLGNSNRMFRLDQPAATVSGQITNTCNSYTCASVPATSACRLIACSYVARQDWNQSSYNYYVCNGGNGGPCCANSGGERGVSCTRRGAGASGSYANWGYRFYDSGRCEAIGGAPDCPKF